MAFRDLREFIQLLEQRGELVRIKTQVDPELEITEITDRISKGPAANNKALLFENVKGSAMPVLINAFGSASRMAWALGVDDLEELNHNLAKTIDLKLPQGMKAALESRARSLRGVEVDRVGAEDREQRARAGSRPHRRSDRALEIAHPQMLAARRRQVHHVDAGHHARSRDEHPQRGHVSLASER